MEPVQNDLVALSKTLAQLIVSLLFNTGWKTPNTFNISLSVMPLYNFSAAYWNRSTLFNMLSVTSLMVAQTNKLSFITAQSAKEMRILEVECTSWFNLVKIWCTYFENFASYMPSIRETVIISIWALHLEMPTGPFWALAIYDLFRCNCNYFILSGFIRAFFRLEKPCFEVPLSLSLLRLCSERLSVKPQTTTKLDKFGPLYAAIHVLPSQLMYLNMYSVTLSALSQFAFMSLHSFCSTSCCLWIGGMG